LQASIPSHAPGGVIHDLVVRFIVRRREVLRGHSQTNSVCDSLPQRPCGYLYAFMLDFRVPRAKRVPG
jgi:hypothetical protein